MKNEPWIDRVYKEKVDSWDVPLDLNHWGQAESMILAQIQKKKNRLLWVWTLGLTGLAGILFVLFMESNKQPAQIEESNPLPATAVSPAEPMARQEKASEKKSTIALADEKTNTDQSGQDHPSTLQKAISDSWKKPNSSNKLIIPSSDIKRKLKTNSDRNTHLEDVGQINQHTNPSSIESTADKKYMDQSRDLVTVHSGMIEALNTLGSELQLIDQPEEGLYLPETFIPIEIEHRALRWKELGLRLALAKQTESVQVNAVSALGFEVYTQKQLGAKGYWGLSLGYNSFFNSSIYSEVLTSYQFKGFGSVVQDYGIKPEWMHYLYLQASLGLQVKKHRAFVGIKPELLLGALGKVDQLKFKEGSTIKDLATAEVSSLDNGWLQNGSLHQVIFNTHVGYEYQFHPKIGIGLQANRNINSLYRPLPGDVSQPIGAKWNIGMRISYKLK